MHKFAFVEMNKNFVWERNGKDLYFFPKEQNPEKQRHYN